MSKFFRSATTVLATGALLVTLGGCALINPPEEERTAIETCALDHTWSLDFEDLSAQLLPELQDQNSKVTDVTATGSQTLDWALNGHAVITSDYVLTVTITVSEDEVQTVEQSRSGRSEGAMTIHGNAVVPSDWEEDYDVTTTVNGEVVEESPLEIYDPLIDDVVALDITCSGGALTTLAHQENHTLTWARTG